MRGPLILFFCFGIGSSVVGQLDRDVLEVKNSQHSEQWTMHFIHQGPVVRNGADGVDIEDVDGDGFPDVVAPWQHASRAYVYLNPAKPDLCKKEWPHRIQLDAGDIEDSVFGDLDGDGSMDVVTANEQTRQLFIHWAPDTSKNYLDASRWERMRLKTVSRLWVQAEVAQLDGEGGLDIIGGAMTKETLVPTLYWYRSPASPRTMEWKEYLVSDKTHSIMGIETVDMDGDGDLDIVTGARHFINWLENPSPEFDTHQPWTVHTVDTYGEDASFLTLADMDQDGHVGIVATDYRDTTGGRVATWYRNHGYGSGFTPHPVEVSVPRPFSGQKNGTKGVVCGDINKDGKPDLVFTTHVESGSTVFWLEYKKSPKEIQWILHDIRTTPAGVEEKYDNVQISDLDRDGDLDVVTSEENLELGVVWFENPYAGKSYPLE